MSPVDSGPEGVARCLKCGSLNPLGKSFCGDCGTALSNDANHVLAILQPELDRKIAAALDARLKDQYLVETETAEKVVNRVFGWAKLVGVPFGAALFVLGVALAAVGISNLADFRKEIADGSRK